MSTNVDERIGKLRWEYQLARVQDLLKLVCQLRSEIIKKEKLKNYPKLNKSDSGKKWVSSANSKQIK